MSLESAAKQRMSSAAPIFILGLMPRTGTHFLGNLLCLHPDCDKSALAEDALTANAHVLARYAERLQHAWTTSMNGDFAAERDELLACLGEGLIEFLHRTRRKALEARAARFNQPLDAELDGKRLVTKSPMVTNLALFFRLFPGAPLLVIVRNGPDTVESYMRSFAATRELADYEPVMQRWATGAQTILRLRDEAREGQRWLIVRYEDLHQTTARELRRVLAFLELDAARYDFAALENVPVVGSSVFKRGAGAVHWLPARKTAEFDPLARAGRWPRELRARFQEIAGEVSGQLGYSHEDA
jgi:hypothetical protein